MPKDHHKAIVLGNLISFPSIMLAALGLDSLNPDVTLPTLENRQIKEPFTPTQPWAAVCWKFGHWYFLRDFYDALCSNYWLLIIWETFVFQLWENRS